jgi:hypothetical protein
MTAVDSSHRTTALSDLAVRPLLARVRPFASSGAPLRLARALSTVIGRFLFDGVQLRVPRTWNGA